MTNDKIVSVVVDIGGTNARFGRIDHSGRLSDVAILKCADYEGIEAALSAFSEKKDFQVRFLALAVACPVSDDRIRFTNNHWSFSKKALREQLGLEKLLVVNDFTAQSMASVSLTEHDFKILQKGYVSARSPILVIGPGTGLGVGGLIPVSGDSWIPLASEGGHATLAAQTARENAVIEVASNDFGHVSAERFVSGSGLVLIYRALCKLDHVPALAESPNEMLLNLGNDHRVSEALDIFAGFFGTVASDACLTMGARGGVIVAGGVIPKLGVHFPVKTFLDRFLAKGRLSDYLADIEIKLILNTEAALVGLSRLEHIRGLDEYFLFG